MLLVFAQIRTVPAAMACLILAGIAQSMSMISIAVILMRSSSVYFRGRVMGVRCRAHDETAEFPNQAQHAGSAPLALVFASYCPLW
jgi:sugar phosphate permease